MAASLSICATRATARDVIVAPSPEGFFGAWLIAGPVTALPSEAREYLKKPAAGEKAFEANFAPRWRAVGSGDDTLNIAGVLQVSEYKAGPRALVGGMLSVPSPFSGWLLLGHDGSAEVFVDGVNVHSGGVGRRYANAWDPIPVRLEAGDHSLVIALHHGGNAWRFAARLLAEDTLMPPPGTALRLPQTSGADGKRLLQSMLRTTVGLETAEGRWSPRVMVSFPRGAPKGRHVITASMRGTDGKHFEVAVGAPPITARGVFDVHASLPSLIANEAHGRATIDLTVGQASSSHRVGFYDGVIETLDRTGARLKSLRAGRLPELLDRAVVVATVEFFETELRAAVGAANAAQVTERLRSLRRILDVLDEGKDPLQPEGGIVELAHRSNLDGALHSFLLHVPKPVEDKPEPKPLVVALHGYRGSPEGIMKAFLGTLRAHPHVDGFVLAPEAFGDAFYRGPGETEVMALIEWAKRTYSIDPNRVAITGVSMGGTGAAHLALRYADHFSAAAPLAGYHSYFVRRDTAGKKRRPWEEMRMRAWSPASWAENGLHLPLHVAHGTSDHPLENSRVLIRRYRALGYSLTEEWPNTGHSVWNVTYAGARLWPVLTRHERPRAPKRVTLVTDSLRYGTSYWAKVTHLTDRHRPARIDASLESATAISVETDNVTGLELSPEGRSKKAPTVVEIDGDTVRAPPLAPIVVEKTENAWRLEAPAHAAKTKRRGAEGPIREVFLEPLVFVYGARRPATARANREVAQAFATRYSGSARYPVVPDHRLSGDIERAHSLFLVGTPDDNAVIERIAAKLPIQTAKSSILVGSVRFDSAQVGALFCAPHPEPPHRLITVLTAPNASGVWRALSLPKLLPDFVVYDEQMSGAAGEQILGDTKALKAGFFDESWNLPVIDETEGAPPYPADASRPGADAG